SLAIRVPPNLDRDVLIKITANPFLCALLRLQIVIVRMKDVICAKWDMPVEAVGTYALLIEKQYIEDGAIKLDFDIPNCASPQLLGVNADTRRLGVKLRSLSWEAVDSKPEPWLFELGRPVGLETRKTFDKKIESGFWERFIRGPNVLDIGYAGGVN